MSRADLLSPISSRRLSLVALTPEVLAMMIGERVDEPPFDWPPSWPDDVDRRHLRIWQERSGNDRNVVWGPRALVDSHGCMVGHAGFHCPPQSIVTALDDPTFIGRREPDTDGVVEIGYTIFPTHRRRRYATEAVTALINWAARTNEVRTILAAVAQDNEASLGVLKQAGGFVKIGTCKSDDVEDVYRCDINQRRGQTAFDA